jgi:hypothetical protein
MLLGADVCVVCAYPGTHTHGSEKNAQVANTIRRGRVVCYVQYSLVGKVAVPSGPSGYVPR